jgi:hypothetical protein
MIDGLFKNNPKAVAMFNPFKIKNDSRTVSQVSGCSASWRPTSQRVGHSKSRDKIF